MPAPIDLTGRFFGRLEVLRVVGHTPLYGGCKVYLCRCRCGAELEVPQKRLPYAEWIRKQRWWIDACATCRGHDCPVCGTRIPLTERAQNPTCSAACADIRRKANQLRYWRKRHRAEPDLPRKMHAARLEKARRDPEYAAKMRLWEERRVARHRERMRSDPEYAARFRARVNAFYAANAERIDAQRKARLDALPPDKLAAWIERARMYTRRYARKRFAEIRANPEEHQKFISYLREYRARKAAQRVAADLARIQTALEERTRGENSDPR